MKRVLGFIGMFIAALPAVVVFGLPYLALGLVVYLIGLAINCRPIRLWGYNVMYTVDQSIAVIWLGQDPDVTISMALGVARKKYFEGTHSVWLGWVYFSNFVNFMFSNQQNHVDEAIEKEESAKNTVVHLYRPLKKDKAA